MGQRQHARGHSWTDSQAEREAVHEDPGPQVGSEPKGQLGRPGHTLSSIHKTCPLHPCRLSLLQAPAHSLSPGLSFPQPPWPPLCLVNRDSSGLAQCLHKVFLLPRKHCAARIPPKVGEPPLEPTFCQPGGRLGFLLGCDVMKRGQAGCESSSLTSRLPLSKWQPLPCPREPCDCTCEHIQPMPGAKRQWLMGRHKHTLIQKLER